MVKVVGKLDSLTGEWRERDDPRIRDLEAHLDEIKREYERLGQAVADSDMSARDRYEIGRRLQMAWDFETRPLRDRLIARHSERVTFTPPSTVVPETKKPAPAETETGSAL